MAEILTYNHLLNACTNVNEELNTDHMIHLMSELYVFGVKIKSERDPLLQLEVSYWKIIKD
jgi:hypothetical protein